MILGIDLDGVCYDFAAALRGYITLTTGRPPSEMPDPQVFTLGAEWGYTTTEFVDVCNAAVDDGVLFREGPAALYCAGTLTQLRSEGHRVHIITARDFGHRSCSNTEHWLHKSGIPFDDITFTHEKWRVKCDVYLDDRIEHYEEYVEADGHPFLFDQPWNREHLIVRRVMDWPHFAEEVRALDH